MTKTTNNQQRTLFKTKPNKACPERSRMGQFPGSASACAELVERSAIWPDEEQVVFSFALAARPVILKAKIRQLRRPMGSEHI